MEKYGVKQKKDKTAGEEETRCPRCGSEMVKHGQVFICPRCGTEPLEPEEEKEEGDEE